MLVLVPWTIKTLGNKIYERKHYMHDVSLTWSESTNWTNTSSIVKVKYIVLALFMIYVLVTSGPNMGFNCRSKTITQVQETKIPIWGVWVLKTGCCKSCNFHTIIFALPKVDKKTKTKQRHKHVDFMWQSS